MELKDIISSGLLELYAMGIASKEENAEVEEWLVQYPELKKEIAETRQALEAYAIAHALEPDPSVKEGLFARINADFTHHAEETVESSTHLPTGKVPRMYSFFQWAAAACFLLLIGSLVLTFTYYNRYRSSAEELAAAHQQMEKQKELATAMSHDMEVVSNKYALPVALNGTPHAPEAEAKIFWMRNTGEVFIDPTNLPEPPSDKQYQLWAIVDGKPVDAGMISSNGSMYHFQKMKTFGKAQAFAITLEKTGGSTTPDMSQMYVMAKI